MSSALCLACLSTLLAPAFIPEAHADEGALTRDELVTQAEERVLLDGKLLGVSSLNTLWTDATGRGYGYGFSVEGGPTGKTVGHWGDTRALRPGLRALLERVG